MYITANRTETILLWNVAVTFPSGKVAFLPFVFLLNKHESAVIHDV